MSFIHIPRNIKSIYRKIFFFLNTVWYEISKTNFKRYLIGFKVNIFFLNLTEILIFSKQNLIIVKFTLWRHLDHK